jgi:hypothetical protein
MLTPLHVFPSFRFIPVLPRCVPPTHDTPGLGVVLFCEGQKLTQQARRHKGVKPTPTHTFEVKTPAAWKRGRTEEREGQGKAAE